MDNKKGNTMPKPLQVAGWILQLIGLAIVYIAFFTEIGPRYGPRYIAVYLLEMVQLPD